MLNGVTWPFPNRPGPKCIVRHSENKERIQIFSKEYLRNSSNIRQWHVLRSSQSCNTSTCTNVSPNDRLSREKLLLVMGGHSLFFYTKVKNSQPKAASNSEHFSNWTQRWPKWQPGSDAQQGTIQFHAWANTVRPLHKPIRTQGSFVSPAPFRGKEWCRSDPDGPSSLWSITKSKETHNFQTCPFETRAGRPTSSPSAVWSERCLGISTGKENNPHTSIYP